MNLVITARHFKLKDDLRDYIEEKCSKLKRYHDGILDVEVILGWEKLSRYTEIIIKAGGKPIILKEYEDELRKSFDLALDKAERQLKRVKEKTRTTEKDVRNSA